MITNTHSTPDALPMHHQSPRAEQFHELLRRSSHLSKAASFQAHETWHDGTCVVSRVHLCLIVFAGWAHRSQVIAVPLPNSPVLTTKLHPRAHRMGLHRISTPPARQADIGRFGVSLLPSGRCSPDRLQSRHEVRLRANHVPSLPRGKAVAHAWLQRSRSRP